MTFLFGGERSEPPYTPMVFRKEATKKIRDSPQDAEKKVVESKQVCYTVNLPFKETDMPRQHQSKAVRKVLAELTRLGFTVEQKKSGVYKITPPPTIKGPLYTTHGTESALHPMRRDFKKYYNIDITV